MRSKEKGRDLSSCPGREQEHLNTIQAPKKRMNRVKDYGGDVHIVSPSSASSVVLLISTQLSNWNASDRHGAPFIKDQWSI